MQRRQGLHRVHAGQALAMKFTQLEDRVLVERQEPEKQRGLIIIPDAHQEKPQVGIVIAVSEGKYGDNGEIIPPLVDVGDRILFGKYSGTEINLDGKHYIIMREGDIL